MTPTYQRSRSGSSELGDLNLELYKNITSSDSEDDRFNSPEPNKRKAGKKSFDFPPDISSSYERLQYLEKQDQDKKKTDSLGTITCSFRYVPKEHRLLVKLIDVSLNYQPSPQVKECDWTLNPVLTVDIAKENRSPESKRKLTSVFHKNSYHTLDKEGTCSISLKNKTNDHYFIKMILYDGDIKHKELAIGVLHINVLSTISPNGSEKIITKDLSMYHQVYLFLSINFKNTPSVIDTYRSVFYDVELFGGEPL